MDIYKTDAGILKIDGDNMETIICGYPHNHDIDFAIKITSDYIFVNKFDVAFNPYGYGSELDTKLNRMGIDARMIYSILNNDSVKSMQIYRR